VRRGHSRDASGGLGSGSDRSIEENGVPHGTPFVSTDTSKETLRKFYSLLYSPARCFP
jgi:hypothetical protein